MAVPKFKTSATDMLAVYEIIRRLSTPFVDTEAYEAGLIDEKGEFQKKRNQMSREEKAIVTRFDVMIFNIKKLLQKLPGGDSKFRNFATALFLLKEETETGLVEQDDVINLAEELDFSTSIEDILEDAGSSAPAVSIGTGAMDNTAAPVRMGGVKRSKFGKCTVFEVDNDTFNSCRMQKKPSERFDKHIKDKKILSEVRDYAKKNPGKSIMISNPSTSAISMLKLGAKEKW